ncbi:uncharacterized protein V1516DRAFT_672014 [Lipomyces oligophaga]|uniref:uncharacterized protein n=1 Tax=Lipomyces oligophaga TaxID=45792 RepID=UPI0034CEFCF9
MSLAMAPQQSRPPAAKPEKKSIRDVFTPERKVLYRNFLFATTATYLSIMIAKRASLARKYIPTMFLHNNTPPPFSRYHDAVHAVTISMLLSTSFFAMGVTGTAMIMDIHSAKEFNQRMLINLGGAEKNAQRAKQVDEEVAAIESSIEDFLNGVFESKQAAKSVEDTKN